MITSNRFRRMFSRFKTSARVVGVHLPESTRRTIELSDEIAALHKRIMERSRSGMPEDVADRERLAMLMEELRAKPTVDHGSVQQTA